MSESSSEVPPTSSDTFLGRFEGKRQWVCLQELSKIEDPPNWTLPLISRTLVKYVRARLKSGSTHAGSRLIHVEPLVIRPDRGVVQNTSSKPCGQAMACIHVFEPSTSIEVGGLEGLSFQVVEVKEVVPCILGPLELGNPRYKFLLRSLAWTSLL